MDSDRVAVGKVISVNMVRQEVRLESLTDFPQRFSKLGKVVFLASDGTSIQSEVAASQVHGDRVVLKVKEPLPPDAPRKLHRALVTVAKEERFELPAGTYYASDLLGMTVFTDQGARLGELVSVLPTGSNDVYEVKGERGEWLLPATREVVKEVDLAAGRMVVHLLKGIEEQ